MDWLGGGKAGMETGDLASSDADRTAKEVCAMSIPVESHFLYSIREQASFTWKSMLCELIDNAFDAKANEVRLSFPGGEVFEIQDDGVGVDDLMQLLTLGGRYDHESNDIGKFGVGCKQAMIWLWGVTEILSRTERDARYIDINWDDVARGISQYPTAESIQSIADNGTTGTRLKCLGTRAYPKFPNLISGLSNTYTPGIELGRSIVFRKSRCNPFRLQGRQWPETEREMHEEITAAGRSVVVRMGIVKQGERNPYVNGFSFERTYRVIKESTLGANEFSVARLAARITLSKEWELSTNKDDFSEFQDELAESIYERFADLMQEGSEQAMTFEDSQFNRELAVLVKQSASRKQRENRNAGDTEGTVPPKNTGRRRTRAANASDDPDGPLDSTEAAARKRSGFSVETYEDTTLTFGCYEPDGNRVRLNLTNGWLRQKHQERNQDALIPVIYGILAEHAVKKDTKKNPLFKGEIEGGFCENWGAAVESIAAEEIEAAQ